MRSTVRRPTCVVLRGSLVRGRGGLLLLRRGVFCLAHMRRSAMSSVMTDLVCGVCAVESVCCGVRACRPK